MEEKSELAEFVEEFGRKFEALAEAERADFLRCQRPIEGVGSIGPMVPTESEKEMLALIREDYERAGEKAIQNNLEALRIPASDLARDATARSHGLPFTKRAPELPAEPEPGTWRTRKGLL